MKKLIIITILLASVFHFNSYAQEKFGRTLNLGLGAGGYSGYYGYVRRILPVFHADYEFDVASNFTLAPSIGFYTYSRTYYYNSGYYNYHETVIPIGVKGTYYFDELLGANPDWDFYAAGSLGYAIVNSYWDAGYNGDKNYYHSASPLFFDIHIGAEYHFSNKAGVFLDLSTGVSTIGIAIHGLK